MPIALAAATLLTGCAPRATLTLAPGPNPGADALAVFGTTLTPTAESLIKKLTGAGNPSGANAPGSAAGASIFDAPGISASLTAAGFSVTSVKVEGSSLAASAGIPSLDGLLAGAVSAKAGSRSLSVTVDPDAVNAAIALMPASTKDYLDLLMAPVFTGEAMTEAEYRDLIGSAYGKTVAAELEAARFTLTVKAPAPVKSARIARAGQNANGGAAAGTVSTDGAAATFTLPLVTLLVLERPITLEMEW